MASAPDLTFRSASTPYSLLNTLVYYQKHYFSGSLPVNQGEKSENLYFRIYNNYAKNSNLSAAYNVRIFAYDGASAVSHTAAKLPISQQWIHMLQNGFGENSTPPGLYTYYRSDDYAIGGSHNWMSAEVGSDGVYSSTSTAVLRANSTGSGVGFLEFLSYASLPASTVDATYNFAITADYYWIP